jgi:hypothetical protein
MTPTPASTIVPVSHPAHPSHRDWLTIIMTALEAACSIGPAVVAVVDPKDATLASNLGKIGLVTTETIDTQITAQPDAAGQQTN